MESSRLRSAAVLIVLLSLTASMPARAAIFGEPTLLADLTPGPDGSTVRFFVPTPNGALFLLYPGQLGAGTPTLWATDGTPGGTVSIEPPDLELPLAPVLWLTEPYVYFDGIDTSTGKPGLWRTDGTLEGTVQIAEDLSFGTRAKSLSHGGLLVFLAGAPAAEPEDVDLELWASDGTAAGTVRLRDYLQPPLGVFGSFVEYAGAIYYLDDDPALTALALWRTDGTPGGTGLVKVLPDASFQLLWSTSSGLYLQARRATDGALALWASDGTGAGTHLVLTLGPQSSLVTPAQFLGELGAWTFWAFSTPSIAPAIWVSDGTAGGTRPILEVAEDDFGAPRVDPFIVPFAGRAYLAADDGNTGREVWRTDGTPEGTEIAIETEPGPASSLVSFRGLAGKLYLALQDPDLGLEPRISDGTAAGTHLLGDLCPGPCSSDPLRFSPAGNETAFLARDPDGRYQVWVTDLTADGTMPLTDFAGGVSAGGSQPLAVGNFFVFQANDGVTGTELWALPFEGAVPTPPLGPWLSTDAVPGFEYKVSITGGGVPIAGTQEPQCIPETACVSGAVPGRSEVFIRVVGPKPNGKLWPTLVKFSTSEIEIWIRQTATGMIRYYDLEGARPGFDELPGLFDRNGFEP